MPLTCPRGTRGTGEAVKGLDKLTDGQLLPKFPEVYWQGIMKMRDKIAHLPKGKLLSKRFAGGIEEWFA